MDNCFALRVPKMTRTLKLVLSVTGVIAVLGGVYSYAMRAEVDRIEKFCDRIVPNTTKVSEIKRIADESRVTLRGPTTLSDSKGPYLFIISQSAFTIGEYACRIRGDVTSGIVTKKRAGT